MSKKLNIVKICLRMIFVDKMPLAALILQSIPESFAIITFGLVMVSVKLNYKKVFIASIISAVASYFVRLLPLSFGVHVILAPIILLGLIKTCCQLSVKRAGLAAFFGLLGLAIVENVTTPIMLTMLNLTTKEALNILWARIIIPLPGTILLLLTAIYCNNKAIAIVKDQVQL